MFFLFDLKYTCSLQRPLYAKWEYSSDLEFIFFVCFILDYVVVSEFI